jgi:hypothetical protein
MHGLNKELQGNNASKEAIKNRIKSFIEGMDQVLNLKNHYEVSETIKLCSR